MLKNQMNKNYIYFQVQIIQNRTTVQKKKKQYENIKNFLYL